MLMLTIQLIFAFSEEKEFETARGGGNQQQRVSDAPKLITNNKFAALRN